MKMTREAIEQLVMEAVSGLLPGFDTSQKDADLVGELGLDSMQVMNLMMEIEDRLDVAVPVETLSQATTLRELVDELAKIIEVQRAG